MTTWPKAAALAAVWAAGGAGAAWGQGVTYVTVTKPEVGGGMGILARMAPGALEESRTTTFLQGRWVRHDEGEASSTLMDLETGRFTFLDHEEKTFTVLTFEEMLAQAQGAVAGAEPPEEEGAAPALEVLRTGKTRRFDGFTAEQVVLVYRQGGMGPEGPARGRGGAGAAETPPTLAFVTEVWVSRDFPGYEALRKAEEALAARAKALGVEVEALGAVGLGVMGGGGGGAGAGGMAGAGAAGLGGGGPAGGPASARLAQELRGLEGIPVRTVTSFVTLPAGAALNVEEILAQADKPLVSAGDVAAAGAREAARQAIGGILGRGRREETRPAEPQTPAAPTVTMRVTQWVEGVRVGPIPEDRFQVPPGYREVREPLRNIER